MGGKQQQGTRPPRRRVDGAPGPTHLILEYINQVIIVPTGIETFASDASFFIVVVSQQVECDTSDYGEVLSGEPGTFPALVFLEGNV
jgi:hypothetical protein